MKKILICFIAAASLAACKSNSAAPSVAPSSLTQTSTPVPSSVASSPAGQIIGGCQIQPKTDCRKADLHGASLTSANLHSSTFTGANFRGADLHKANLRGVDFRKADLAGADLSEAKLQQANLDQASLAAADLSYANLTGANATTTQLQASTLCHTIMPDGTDNSTGCAGASPSASPSPAPNKLAITKFDVSNADCLKSGHKRSNVRISYATTGASKVSFGFAGTQAQEASSTSGSYKLRIQCSSKTVTVYMYAFTGHKSVTEHKTVGTGL